MTPGPDWVRAACALTTGLTSATGSLAAAGVGSLATAGAASFATLSFRVRQTLASACAALCSAAVTTGRTTGGVSGRGRAIPASGCPWGGGLRTPAEGIASLAIAGTTNEDMSSLAIARISTPSAIFLLERITASGPSASRTWRQASRDDPAINFLTFMLALQLG